MTRFDPRRTRALSRAEWGRLGGFAAGVLALHVLGASLLLVYAPDHPALTGLGWAAYLLGLRHAFDADHLSAIDTTTRRLMHDGQRPLGVGFFFSLGHSTVVLSLAAGLAAASDTIDTRMPAVRHYGGYVGASVAGTFLWVVGVLNLLVLLDIHRIARRLRRGGPAEIELQALPARGPLSRVFGRLLGVIQSSWQMYPVGLLFGLGLDTASEVGLLALSAGAARDVPVAAILALPILFAAGMSLMDTADGAFMTQAYGWAFSNPARKVYYNLIVTSLTVAIALGVGTVELLQVVGAEAGLSGPFWDAIAALDLETLGYAIVVLFLVAWCGSYAIWKLGRIEERWSPHSAPE